MAVPSAASYRAFPGLHRAIGGSGTQNAHGREQSEDYEHPMNIEEVRSRTSSGAANICSKLRVRNRSVRFIIFAVKLSCKGLSLCTESGRMPPQCWSEAATWPMQEGLFLNAPLCECAVSSGSKEHGGLDLRLLPGG